MKKIAVILILCIGSFWAYGQGIEFYHGPYAEVLKKARKEKKQIFVDVYTSWCGPCKMMARDVFSRQEVGEYYNRNFVCLKLDAEKEKDYPFFEKYQAGGYPSMFWLDTEGKLIDMHVGYMEAPAFILKGQQLKDSRQVEIWEGLQKRWDAGERSSELMDKYVFGYLAKAKPEKTKACCMDYLKSLDETQVKTEHTYRILQAFSREFEDGIVVDYRLKYWNDYQQYDDYMTFNTNNYRWLVRNANVSLGKSEEALQEHIRILQGKEFPQKEMFMAIIDAETTLIKNRDEGLRRMHEVAVKYGKENPWLYTQFAYSIVNAGYFISEDKSAEHQQWVREITERAYELFPSQETAVYVAATYMKEGNLKEAYATLGVLPFLKTPMLSSALYQKVGLNRRPLTGYSRDPECKDMQLKVNALTKKKRE